MRSRPTSPASSRVGPGRSRSDAERSGDLAADRPVAVGDVGGARDDDDARAGFDPCGADLPMVEAALWRKGPVRELVGEVDHVVRVGGIGLEAKARQVGDAQHVEIVEPPGVLARCPDDVDGSIAAVVEEVDKVLDERHPTPARRVVAKPVEADQHGDRRSALLFRRRRRRDSSTPHASSRSRAFASGSGPPVATTTRGTASCLTAWRGTTFRLPAGTSRLRIAVPRRTSHGRSVTPLERRKREESTLR